MAKTFLHSFQLIEKTRPNTPKRLRFSQIVLYIKICALLFIVLTVAAALSLWWFSDLPLSSPINSLSSFRFLQEQPTFSNEKKVVYGYLPYWNLATFSLQPEVTHLGYFSLTIGSDGSLLQQQSDGAEPGFSRFKSDAFLEVAAAAEKQNTTVELVLTQFDAGDITAFLTSETAQKKLLDSLDSILLAQPVSGISIDIELNGTPSPALRKGMTQFMKNVRSHLDSRYEHLQLSVALYASASEDTGIWDITELSSIVDYLIVMAYDFHRRGSTQAGPVAPLFGGKKLWDTDINHHLQNFIKKVPSRKLLLGIPFYGYEWQTTSRDAQSHTFPDTGSTASVARVQELLKKKKELKVQEHWNSDALSPYLSYIENDLTYVIYYEDSRSISYKLDFVNQLELGGVAIWALGYEGQSRELWDVIKTKIKTR